PSQPIELDNSSKADSLGNTTISLGASHASASTFLSCTDRYLWGLGGEEPCNVRLSIDFAGQKIDEIDDNDRAAESGPYSSNALSALDKGTLPKLPFCPTLMNIDIVDAKNNKQTQTFTPCWEQVLAVDRGPIKMIVPEEL